MAWQPPKTAIITAQSALSTIKSLSNECKITNEIAFFQIITLKCSRVRNDSSAVKNIASEIANGWFDNNFIGAPQKFGYVIGDSLQSIDIADVYNKANAINTNFPRVIFILDGGSKSLDTWFLGKPFSQYVDIFHGGKAVKRKAPNVPPPTPDNSMRSVGLIQQKIQSALPPETQTGAEHRPFDEELPEI